MDRFWRRPSHARVTTIVDRTSQSCILSNHPQGNQLVAENNKLLKIGSHYSTWSSLEISENRLSFDNERGNGTPMKKLLADEMGRETESGRRSPNLIARLMGLDGLSAAHSTSKKQKRVSVSHQQGSISSAFSKNSKLHDSRSHRKIQQPFEDVHEVKGGLKRETKSNNARTASNRRYHDDEIDFIGKQFMDAKHFYPDDNIQHSKEFHDTLYSNKDLLLRFPQEPDSLFSSRLHDLHGVPESNFGYVVGRSSKNARCQTTDEASRKMNICHSYKHCINCYNNMYDRNNTDLHMSNISDEANKSAFSNHSDIVVLNPHLGKVLNTAKSIPSIRPSRLRSAFELSPQHLVVEMRSKGSKNKASASYVQNSRGYRERAKEITCQTENNFGRDSLNFRSLGSKGYSADESSHDTSESDSSCESEVFIVSSQTSSDRLISERSSSLRCMESYVNMEAKKRLSERWKMTHSHRFQEFDESSKGSTLAEMLAIPDFDIRSQSPDTAAQDDYYCNFEGTERKQELFNPLGISSRDGWRGEYVHQTLPRSRHVRTYGNHFGSPKSSSKREAITAENFLIKNKASKRDSRRKDGSFMKNKELIHGKCQSYSSVESVYDNYKVQANGNPINSVIDGKDSPEVKTVILETPSCRHDRFLPLEEKVPEQKSHSCASPQMDYSSIDTSTFSQVGGSSCLQCTETYLESPASSKESEQPSPVSVLKSPFVEDLSFSSECFERVSAGLDGLRIQLQLLKQESEVYDEGIVLFTSDECADESSELYDDKYLTHLGNGWKSSYLIDVLALSGLDKTNCESFRTAWHSPDCPIGPWVFDDLEKRYSELASCSKSDRNLLYDHINTQIMEIAQQFVGVEPWVKNKGKNVNSQQLKAVLKTELQKVLEKHENKALENNLDMIILSNMGWMMLEEHISLIGRDIAALLIDEQVSETLHALYNK